MASAPFVGGSAAAQDALERGLYAPFIFAGCGVTLVQVVTVGPDLPVPVPVPAPPDTSCACCTISRVATDALRHEPARVAGLT